MAKVNAQQLNPERFALVREEQEDMKRQYRGMLKVARLCPYCDHRVEDLARGQHGYTMAKCPNCGQEVVFPPISFRLAH